MAKKYEYEIHVNYGQGWEHEVTDETLQDARDQVECYRDNVPYPVKMVKRRLK